MFQFGVTILDAILNNSKRSMMPAGHHSDSDSTLLPLPKSSVIWFGGIFARLPPLAVGLCVLGGCPCVCVSFHITYVYHHLKARTICSYANAL